MRMLGGFIENTPISLADKHFDDLLCNLNNNKRTLPHKTRFSRLIAEAHDELDIHTARDEIVFVRGKPFSKSGEALQAPALLALYKVRGERMAQELTGHFLIIIANRYTAHMSVINDKFSSYPFYYSLLDSLFVFCDQIKDLAAAKMSRLELNILAIQDYMQWGKPIQGRTWFHNILALKPGETLNYEEGELYIWAHEDFSFATENTPNLEDPLGVFKHVLSQPLKNLNHPVGFLAHPDAPLGSTYLYEFSKRIRDSNQLRLFKTPEFDPKTFFELVQYWLYRSDHAFCDLNTLSNAKLVANVDLGPGESRPEVYAAFQRWQTHGVGSFPKYPEKIHAHFGGYLRMLRLSRHLNFLAWLANHNPIRVTLIQESFAGFLH